MINTNSNLPNMSNTIKGWFLNISFEYVERYQQGADWIEGTPQIVNTKGVVRPPSDEDLKIYPEGAWSWQCLPNADMATNNYVIYDDVKYKIMQKKDYRKYGYIRYTLLEAYKADELSNE
mgnify:CR=1 FL=1